MRLHDGLKIIGREDIEGQKQEGQRVGADDRRGDGENFRRGAHENMDIQVRGGKAERRPEKAEEGRCAERKAKGFTDARSLPRAEVGGDDGLGGLTDAVRAALNKGADVDDRAVDGQRVRAERTHDLPIEQDGQNAHGDINKEAGKARDGNQAEFLRRIFDAHEAQGIFPAGKMGQHDDKGDGAADGCGQTCAENAHVAGENEEIIAEDIEDAAGEHADRRKAGIVIVAQERGQHLVKQEERKHDFDGAHVFHGQRKKRFIRAEEGQNRALKAENADPREEGEKNRADDGRGEKLVFVAAALAAALHAENDAAADAHQQAEAVNHIPDRGDDSQRRRAARPLILADHRHIDHAVDARNQRAAKGGGEVFEIQGFDFAG